VLILQPFNYAKNMVQQKQPIVLNPAVMYRGVGANALNMGSCTMIQFVVGGSLKNVVLAGEHRHLSLAEEMVCGIGAGAVSALVGSPLELIMIQQQRKGGATFATIQNIGQLSPLTFTRGFTGAMIRESLWTCGYLSIPPVVRRTLMESYPDQFPNNNTARVPAALLGGLFACYLTHPADTIKTCMQGDIERKVYGSFTQTAAKIWSESSLPGFYRGATFRYGRMVCAVFIMDFLKEHVGQLLYPAAFQMK
jgi:Mitochondrial carrier protein